MRSTSLERRPGAQTLPALEAVVPYDVATQAAADALGLTVEAPDRPPHSPRLTHRPP